MTDKILIDTGPSERGVHRLETAGHCGQLYSFTYNFGRQSDRPPLLPVSMPLVRGTLGHIGLAHYYARLACTQRKMNPDVYFDPLEAIDEKIKRMDAAKEPGYTIARDVRDLVHRAVTGYFQHYAMETMQVAAVEHVVRMQFKGYLLTQRMDLIVQDRAGKFWCYDHKFVASIQSKSVTRYNLSPQFLEMYHQGVNAFGPKFGGLRINLIGCEGDVPKFQRASPEPSPFALQMFPRWVEQTEQKIESWKTLDPWDHPKSFGEQSCVTPYGPCPGTELCRNGP